jgi:mannosyl-3-phosphoglycerate phosphatase
LQLIFFSDLDGTLLDHQTYDFTPAQPALDALNAAGVPLVLASSKTGPEISELRKVLGLSQWPAIVENGAGELAPGENTDHDDSAYQQLRHILGLLPSSLRGCYTGFGDMTVADVVANTGLSTEAARLAKQRSFTEPGLFCGSETLKAQFVSALAEHSVVTVDGGRFLTLSFGGNKADGLLAIVKRLQARESVALGDAPNDAAMLRAATRAVIVRNDHSPDPGEIPGAIRTTLSGPAGWNEAVLAILAGHKLYPLPLT